MTPFLVSLPCRLTHHLLHYPHSTHSSRSVTSAWITETARLFNHFLKSLRWICRALDIFETTHCIGRATFNIVSPVYGSEYCCWCAICHCKCTSAQLEASHVAAVTSFHYGGELHCKVEYTMYYNQLEMGNFPWSTRSGYFSHAAVCTRVQIMCSAFWQSQYVPLW